MRSDEVEENCTNQEEILENHEAKLRGIERVKTEIEEPHTLNKGVMSNGASDDITRLNEKEKNCSSSEIIINNQAGKIEQTQENNKDESTTKKCDPKRERSTKIRYELWSMV